MVAKAAQPGAARDLTRERDEACKPVAIALIQALAKRDDLPMGSQLDAGAAAEYMQKVYQEDCVPLLLKHNLKLKDISFVFSIILQPFQFLSDVTTSSFEMNRDIADGFKYGMPDIDEMRVLDLDAALKEGVENLKNKAAAKQEVAKKPEPRMKKKRKTGDK